MTKLLTDRVRLLRGLQAAQRNGFSDAEKAVIAKIITAVRKDPAQQFLSYSQDELCKISYAHSPSHRLDSVKRTRTTLPRYIRRQLGITPDQLKDHLLDALGTYVFAALDPDPSNPPFQFLKGMPIVKAYKTGPSSCMSGCSACYTQFYALNPKRVQLMTLAKPVTFTFDGTQYTQSTNSRALLWTADDGRRMLDRIYIKIGSSGHNEGNCGDTLSNGTNGHCVCRDIIRAFRNWASRHNVINRNCLTDEFLVTMKVGRHVPYMDTLSWGNYDSDDILVLSNLEGDHCLQRTDGLRPGEENDDDSYTCNSCDCSIDGDDVYTGSDDNPYCEHCFQQSYFHCDECSAVESRDYLVEVDRERYCRECTATMLKQCVDCLDHGLIADMHVVHAPEGEVHVCDKCIKEYTCCDGCLEYHSRTFKHEGNDFCRKCHDKALEHAHEPAAA